MLQVPSVPQDATVRALAQQYAEQFTGLTVSTITLSYEPQHTVDGVGMEQVYKNGKLLTTTPVTGGNTSATTWYRERCTGSTSATWALSHTPDAGVELVAKNGTILDPSSQYSIASATITLGSAPVAGDVLIAHYPVTTTSAGSSAGTSYTIDGKTITLDQALVVGDLIVVKYPYRT